MAIEKYSGVAWSSVAKLSGVANADIAKVNGQDTPSSASITSGAWYDIRPWDSSSDSGSGNTVTNIGSLGGTTTFYNGYSTEGITRTTQGGADCWFMDGANDDSRQYVNYSDVSSLGYPFTQEAWLYRETRPTGNTQLRPHVGMSITSEQFKRSRMAISAVSATFSNSSIRNRLAFGQKYDTTNIQLNVIDSTPAYGAWYHLAVVFTSTQMKVYIDGSQHTTGSFTMGLSIFDQVASSQQLIITMGAWVRANTSNDIQRGYHGDYRIYTSELTAQEIQNNFDATKSYYGK
tara:strand:- start:629 stop:1498 length:870 start_codon:yes stop_codon:yes gene_type:complete